MCVSELSQAGSFRVGAPELAGEPSRLLARLQDRANGETVALGFDFPIGLPSAYAARAGITRFKDVLPKLGHGEEWGQFYEVAESSNEIHLRRPFYPYRPGGTRQEHAGRRVRRS